MSRRRRDNLLFVEDIVLCIEKIERYNIPLFKKQIVKVLEAEKASERGAKKD